VGRHVRIGRHSYTVIGVLQSKGQSPFGADQDDRLVMPIGGWFSRINPSTRREIQILMISAPDAASIWHAQRVTYDVMRGQHRLKPNDEPDFLIATQREFQATQDRIMGVLSMLLLSVASISLVVGGVGVTNIMLVAINERRREIGLRLAIGAEPGDIRLQFL